MAKQCELCGSPEVLDTDILCKDCRTSVQTSQVQQVMVAQASHTAFPLPTRSTETGVNYLAPICDVEGKALWSDDVVLLADKKTEAVLRFGPYNSVDETGVASGWGWYLQVGVYDTESTTPLELYSLYSTPVVVETNGILTKIDKDEPSWWAEYIEAIDDRNSRILAHNEIVKKYKLGEDEQVGL